MKRAALILAIALITSSCASPTRLVLGQSHDWKPKSTLTVGIELQERTDDYLLKLEITSGLFYETPSVLAWLRLEDGTVVKGMSPTKTHPDWGDTGTSRSGFEVRFVKSPSKSKPRFLRLKIHEREETFEVFAP